MGRGSLSFKVGLKCGASSFTCRDQVRTEEAGDAREREAEPHGWSPRQTRELKEAGVGAKAPSICCASLQLGAIMALPATSSSLWKETSH